MSVRKLYNADAHANNTIVLHASQSGCCGSDAAFCKASYTGAQDNLEGIVYTDSEGVSQTVLFDATPGTAKEIRKAIAAAIRSVGYDPYYPDSFHGIQTKTGEICIVGELKVTHFVRNGAQVAVTEKCELGKVCKFTGMVDFDTNAGVLSVNGSAGTQVGAVAGFPAGDAAAVQTAIAAAMTTEGLGGTVTATENTTAGVYTFEIHAVGEPTISLGGNALTNCGCYPDFVA